MSKSANAEPTLVLIPADKAKLNEILRRTEGVYYRIATALKALDADFSGNPCMCSIDIIGPAAVLKDANDELYKILRDLPEAQEEFSDYEVVEKGGAR